MVEINNQRKAFLDMLAWSEGTDNGRQKTRNHGYDVIVGRRAIYWLLRSPSQTCHAKLRNSNQQAPDAQLLSRWWDATASSLAWKDFSPESQDGMALRRWSVALYLWLIVVISVRQSTVAAISGLHCRALVMVGSSMGWQPWCKIQRSGRNGQRDWCETWSHRDYLRSGYLHHRLPVMGYLIVTVITPLPTKPSATKIRRTEAGERGNYWHADASAWCCCARCKIHEELADAKAENDALRDDVADIVSFAHQSSLSVGAWSHHRLRRG